MSFTYSIILLISLSYPLFRSFGSPLYFYKKFHALFPAIVITAVIYLTWDTYFTNMGYWGFNSDYLLGYFVGSLPIEEILFFIIIPFSCMFIYEVIRYLLLDFSTKFNHQIIHISSMLILFLVFISNMDKVYTSTAALYSLVVLLLTWVFQRDILPLFYLSFIFMLIPFLIVNGVLTGAFIPEEVVWYNNEENLGIRLHTIPLDDIIYCFGMMLTVTTLYEFFLTRKLKRQSP